MSKYINDIGIRAKREVGIEGPDVTLIFALFGAALMSITAVMWAATGYQASALLIFSVVMLSVCLVASFVRYWKYRKVQRTPPQVNRQEKFLLYMYIIGGVWITLGCILGVFTLLNWLFAMSTGAYGIVALVCAVFVVLGAAIRRALHQLSEQRNPDKRK